jgi:alpha-glucosidase
VRIKPALAELPVFVRGGSIFARQPLVQSTAEKPQGPLELRVYPADNCQGSVYQDDGISFAYTRGAYRRQAFSCQQQSGVVSLHFNPSEGTFTPWWSRVEVVIFGWTSAKVSITLNEKPITASQFDAPHGALHILIPDQPQGGELRVIAK